MTLKEIVYNIKNLKAGGIQSDDSKLADDQYAAIVHYYRAKLVRQEIDRGGKLDPNLIQSINGNDSKGIEVDRVPFNRGEPLSGKTVFRTVKDIPKAIATKNTNLVTFVGHSLLGQAFQRTTPYKAQFDIYRPYTGLNIKWFEFDDKIFVITEDGLRYITIQIVAENPSKVVELNGDLNVFDPLDYEYPISVTMLDSIYKLMADMELKYGSLLTDDLNDGLESPTDK